MADLSGVHFEYGGVSSRLYGLITANVETTRFTKVAGDISGVTIYNKKNRRRYLIDNDSSDSPLSFELDIVTDDERPLEFNERRQIEKWLFNRGQYKKFYIDMEDDCLGETTELIDGVQKRLYMNCRFINPERLEYNGGIVGYKVTMETDSCMWWQEPVTKTFTISAPNSTSVTTTNFTVTTDSDLDDYIYPKFTITAAGATGEVRIINNSDDAYRIFSIVTVGEGAPITINSETNYISSGVYSTLNNKNFPRLLDGDNVFTIQGCVASVQVEFQNRRNL